MDRKVLVTGGSNGIGKAVAGRFRASGDNVVITGRDAARLAEAARQTGARPITCDATDPGDVARLAAELGPQLNVLVNNAGGNTDFGQPSIPEPSLHDVASAWRANLDANLLSAVLTTTALLGKLQAQGSVIR